MQKNSEYREVFPLMEELYGYQGNQPKVSRYLADSFQDRSIIFSENLRRKNNWNQFELYFALEDQLSDNSGRWLDNRFRDGGLENC